MKKFLIVSVALVGSLLGYFTYERLFIEQTIGPAALAALLFVALLFMMLLGSLLLFGTRHRRMVGNIWLTIFSVALTYIVVDLTAGYILIKPLSPPLVPDNFRHHRLVPNSNAQFTQQDFSYVQRVNNLGMRGADRPASKPEGTIRIVMLGDSFTMGKGVEDDETFSVGVERLLNRRLSTCPSGLKVEVLNGGVDSYAPILSYIQLKRDVLTLKPDLVVFNLDVSDLVQEAAYRQVAEYTGNGEVIGVPQTAPMQVSLTERVRTWVERRLFLTRLLLYHVNRRYGFKELSVRDVVTTANFEVAAHTLESDSVPREQQWQDIFESIKSIKLLTDSHRIGFMLTAYPWGHQVNEKEWQPGRESFVPKGAVVSDNSIMRVQRFAEENRLQFINLFPAFRAYSGESALYFKFDAHFTPAGHMLMATELGNKISNHFLDQWCDHE